MHLLKNSFKPEDKKKNHNSDSTKNGMKIGPVPDLQELQNVTADISNKFLAICSR